MMGAFVSPGAYTREMDFSLYVPALATTIFGIVTTATKGPVDEVTLCTTEEQLVNNFGPPGPMNLGLLAGIEYLRQGNQLMVVRIAGYGEATGTGTAMNTATTPVAAVTFTATSSGSWVNGLNGVQVSIRAGRVANSYDITVLWRGVTVEFYDSVNITAPTSNDYIETRMAGSQFVTATVITGASPLATATVQLAGGDDGSSTTAADYIGTVGAGTRTGLQLFADPEKIDVNLIAVPGISDANVILAMMALCETRQDCMCLVDPPTGLNAQQIVAWHNGTSGLTNAPTAALNSSYAALYWDWVKSYDPWSASELYKPPSGYAACQYALTDRDYETWFAPAGYRRGRLINARGVAVSPTQGERDYMQGGRAGTSGINRVNPIVNFAGFGLTIWGQSTLQRATTALDSINVRRMLLYLRKVIATAIRYLVFEPNDDRMWADFRNLVRPFLEVVQTGRGLNNFNVVMDKTTNPPAIRAQKTAVGYLMLEPTLAAEKIIVNFTLLPQGANFDEVLV